MTKDEYKLILELLDDYSDDSELATKLIEKIKLYIKHDEVQEEYNSAMKEISDKMTKLLSPKEDSK